MIPIKNSTLDCARRIFSEAPMIAQVVMLIPINIQDRVAWNTILCKQQQQQSLPRDVRCIDPVPCPWTHQTKIHSYKQRSQSAAPFSVLIPWLLELLLPPQVQAV